MAKPTIEDQWIAMQEYEQQYANLDLWYCDECGHENDPSDVFPMYQKSENNNQTKYLYFARCKECPRIVSWPFRATPPDLDECILLPNSGTYTGPLFELA